MKKIIPIIALIGAGAVVAIDATKTDNNENFINNINSFKEDLSEYSNLSEQTLSKTAFNKYNLSIIADDLNDLNLIDDNVSVLNTNETNNEDVEEDLTDTTQEILPDSTNEQMPNEETLIDNNNDDDEKDDFNFDENIDLNQEDKETIEQISTLYSLSNDIEDSCEDFCELKENLTNAILETQNLINKIQQNELELSREQRMFITEQSSQLKNLGRQLSNVTTELSFNLSDLNQVFLNGGDNINNLNLKYLVVLDNLVNGNEMLQSSLNSLNLINQMFNMNSPLPPNNQGRVLYGFQHNNNPPVIKDYYIDENGEMIENTENTDNTENLSNPTENEAVEVESKKKTNIDTYQNRALTTNIDSYQNTNLPRNIDSFFNTALLDNEFMYGNGGYGYAGMNGMYGPANPYMQRYANYEQGNTINGDYNVNNTQYNSNLNNQNEQTHQNKKEKKRIKLKKNIDTYKDENEPDIKTKLGNIKNSITGFFGKFKRSDLNIDIEDKIDNPIYRFNAKNN